MRPAPQLLVPPAAIRWLLINIQHPKVLSPGQNGTEQRTASSLLFGISASSTADPLPCCVRSALQLISNLCLWLLPHSDSDCGHKRCTLQVTDVLRAASRLCRVVALSRQHCWEALCVDEGTRGLHGLHSQLSMRSSDPQVMRKGSSSNSTHTRQHRQRYHSLFWCATFSTSEAETLQGRQLQPVYYS